MNIDTTRTNLSVWTRSKDFVDMASGQQKILRTRIIIGIVAFGLGAILPSKFFLISGTLIGLWGVWAALKSINLRRQIKTQRESFQPITCSVVIANSAALQSPGSQAAAALIGGFESDKPGYLDAIDSAALELGMLYGQDPDDVAPEMQAACRLINDDGYQVSRRRPIPVQLSKGHQLFLFDSILHQSYFPEGKIDSPHVYMAAAPKGGPIVHLPLEIVDLPVSGYDPNIIRHEAPEKDGITPPAESISLEIIHQHIEDHFGSEGAVFHEIVSDTVHIDIHVIPPADDRDYSILVTSGMSDLPMTTPQEQTEFSRAELCLRLPRQWPLTQEDFKDEANYWPLRILKVLARMPHELSTWLCYGHTIPLGDGKQTASFQGVILGPPIWAPESFGTADLIDQSFLHFWSVIPIYQSELDYKLKHGSDALFEKLETLNAWDLITPGRPAVI